METNNKEGLPSDYTFKGKGYNCHYSEHKNYSLWKTALSWIDPGERVLDMGCGTGQFGHMLDDNNIEYIGWDFSRDAIRIAEGLKEEHNLNAHFFLADIKSAHWSFFDVYVLFSVLEHIKDDLSIIRGVPTKSKIIFIVPSFKYIYHVRIFRNKKEIIERYGDLIDIEEIIMEKRRRGNKQFLVKGVKK